MSKLIICYDGSWNGNSYEGGVGICATLESNAKYGNLVDLVYSMTDIDRRKFDIKIHYLAVDGNGKVMKSLIKNDQGVMFLTLDSELKMIYIDTIVREFQDSRPSVRQFVPGSLRDLPQVHNNFGFDTARVQVSGYGGTPSESPMPNNYDEDEEDEDDWEESNDGDDETPAHMYGGPEEDSISDGTDVEEIGRKKLPEIIYSGAQFAFMPQQINWVVPGAGNYAIQETQTEASTFYQPNTLYQGAIFGSKEALTTAIGIYALECKFDYRIRRSCKVRFGVGCKDLNCNFRISARCRPGCKLWHVYKFLPDHTCVRDTYDSHFRNVKAIIIGHLYSKKLLENSSNSYTPKVVIGEMRETYGVDIMKTKAWRALEHAKKLAYGDVDESYQQLPSYFHMLKEVNPGTLTAIERDENDRFLYSFVALGACIQGFLTYMRPVIAVDATHLKGRYPGVIFFAACKDGEEMIYPIAFGFGDGESDRSWTWFLSRLRMAIGQPEDLLIVSDRHRSIKNAMRVVFPSVPHVYCFFHMKKNLQAYCKQQPDVMKTFYAAAYSYLTSQCDELLTELEHMHPTVHRKLVEAGVQTWSLSHCPKRRYKIMTTNIAESLNSCMKEARRLPITSAHEFVRHMLMGWFSQRREKASELTSTLTSDAETRMTLVDELSSMQGCIAHPIIEMTKYVVRHVEKGDGIVDVVARSCSCRMWDLDQLPCLHAAAVARHMRVHYSTFCHQYYSTAWLKAAYAPPINPVPVIYDWNVPVEIREIVVRPPVGRRQAGRPRECRIPSAGEPRRRKICGKCHQPGHNRVRCPNLCTSSSVGESSSTAVESAQKVRKCSICHQTGHTRRRCHLQPTANEEHVEGVGNDEHVGDDAHVA